MASNSSRREPIPLTWSSMTHLPFLTQCPQARHPGVSLATWTISESTPFLFSSSAISERAVNVQPLAWGLPLIRSAFMPLRVLSPL